MYDGFGNLQATHLELLVMCVCVCVSGMHEYDGQSAGAANRFTKHQHFAAHRKRTPKTKMLTEFSSANLFQL